MKNDDDIQFNINNNENKEDQNQISNLNQNKQKIKEIMDEVLKNFFMNKNIETEESEKKIDFTTSLCNDVIKEVSSKINGYKFICTGFIVYKGQAGFHHDCNSLWDKKTDGIITATFTNERLYCFVNLFAIAP